MRRSKSEIYLHIVWTTWNRQPYLSPEIEKSVYRCIQDEARRLEATILAIGGMPDYIHIVVRVPAKVSASALMQQVKGVSSHFIGDQLLPDQMFRWQEGYGVFSLGRNQVDRVIAYVHNQKKHHQANRLWPEWESADEERPPAD